MTIKSPMTDPNGFDDTLVLVREPWATFIPGRSPMWKMHTNIGQAKNAIQSGCSESRPVNRGAIYERQGSVWVKRFACEAHAYNDPDLSREKIKEYLSWMKPTPLPV